MDNPTTLLVAIMYVTIVATGLINALMTLSEIAGGQRKAANLQTVWILLLLFSYFNFFWETTAILDIEGWDFLSFLAFMVGPVVLLFATNLIVALPDAASEISLGDFYLAHSGRFFVFLAVVQVWIIGLDVVFESISATTYVTAFQAALFVVLVFSRNRQWHIAGAFVVGFAFLARMMIEAL